MRKLIGIVAGCFLAVACTGQTNKLPIQNELWGATTNGVQVSVSVTNYLPDLTNLAFFSITIKNGSTNTIRVTLQDTYYARGELVDTSGKHFITTRQPGPISITRVPPRIFIGGGITTNLLIELPLLAPDEGGNVVAIPSGEYKFKATVWFALADAMREDKGYWWDATSNEINFQVKPNTKPTGDKH